MTVQAFAGPAASGLVDDDTFGTADLLDLLDPTPYRTSVTPDGYAERAAAAAALFVGAGANASQICTLTRTHWKETSGEWIALPGKSMIRIIPLLLVLRIAVARYVGATPAAPGCDALFVDRHGLPCNPMTLHYQFANFAARVGLPGVHIPLRLRNIFVAAVQTSDDGLTARHLIEGPAVTEHQVALARKRSLLTDCHPLGVIGRAGLHHIGPVARAFPDREYSKLSRRSQFDFNNAKRLRAGPYPDAVRLAILKAVDAGHLRKDIAAHYGIPGVYVNRAQQRRAANRLLLARGGGLRLASNRNVLIRTARENPDWSAPMLAEEIRERHRICVSERHVYHTLGKVGIKLAKARHLEPHRDFIRAAVAADPLVQNLEIVALLRAERGVETDRDSVAREVRRLALGRKQRNTRPALLACHDKDIRRWMSDTPDMTPAEIRRKLATLGTDAKPYLVRAALVRLGLRHDRTYRRVTPFHRHMDAIIERTRTGATYDDIVEWLAREHGIITNKVNVGHALRERGLGVGRWPAKPPADPFA